MKTETYEKRMKQHNVDYRVALSRYCRQNNIIYRTSKQENCLKREVWNV